MPDSPEGYSRREFLIKAAGIFAGAILIPIFQLPQKDAYDESFIANTADHSKRYLKDLLASLDIVFNPDYECIAPGAASIQVSEQLAKIWKQKSKPDTYDVTGVQLDPKILEAMRSQLLVAPAWLEARRNDNYSPKYAELRNIDLLSNKIYEDQMKRARLFLTVQRILDSDDKTGIPVELNDGKNKIEANIRQIHFYSITSSEMGKVLAEIQKEKPPGFLTFRSRQANPLRDYNAVIYVLGEEMHIINSFILGQAAYGTMESPQNNSMSPFIKENPWYARMREYFYGFQCIKSVLYNLTIPWAQSNQIDENGMGIAYNNQSFEPYDIAVILYSNEYADEEKKLKFVNDAFKFKGPIK